MPSVPRRGGRASRHRFPLAVRWLLVATLAAGLGAMLHLGTALVADAPLRSPGAIVSLASHEWERLPAAAILALENPDASVILTEPEEVTPYNCHECATRVRRLASLGIDSARVHVVRLDLPGTYGEAMAVRAFVRAHGIARLNVVTSPYHTRRALATFRAALASSGTQVGVVPAYAASPAVPARWWTAPYDRSYVAYEWAATLYYAVKYRVFAFTV
jgi:uncharacterized SAM-binding protein YcdF (DUF218 family)